MREVGWHGDEFVGVIAIDEIEPVLAGHFPGFPILPGVCLVECVHQTALVALSPHTALPALRVIEKVRFLEPVFPGDQLTVHIGISTHDDGWACRARVVAQRPSTPGRCFEAAVVKLRYGTTRHTAAMAKPRPATPPAKARWGIADLKRMIPHRYPMLLLDRIEGVSQGQELVATKAISANEPWYAGLSHEDDHGYPDVLLVESWCQAAGVLAVRDHLIPDVLSGQVTLFGGITNITLSGRVQPGDVVEHRVRAIKLLSQAAVFEGESLVGDVPVLNVEQIVIVLRPADELTKVAVLS
jgi:3-hydroxyacyl-[acyl-carrier-protein] dehydratase